MTCLRFLASSIACSVGDNIERDVLSSTIFIADSSTNGVAFSSTIFIASDSSTDGVTVVTASSISPANVESTLGVIAKRPIANGAWRALESPNVSSAPSNYAEEYYRRAQIMGDLGELTDEPDDRILTSMGFVFSFDQVNVGIIGTQNLNHFKSNINMFNQFLPIPNTTIEDLCLRFDKVGQDWQQRT